MVRLLQIVNNVMKQMITPTNSKVLAVQADPAAPSPEEAGTVGFTAARVDVSSRIARKRNTRPMPERHAYGRHVFLPRCDAHGKHVSVHAVY